MENKWLNIVMKKTLQHIQNKKKFQKKIKGHYKKI